MRYKNTIMIVIDNYIKHFMYEIGGGTIDNLDSTEMEWIINEMAKQNKRLEIINQVAKSINIQMSYEEIIKQMSKPLSNVISYDLLSFCLVEEDTLIIKSGIPKEQKLLGVGCVLKKDNSAPWEAVKHKKCFLRQDIWNDLTKYQEDDDLREIGIKSAIMAPLLINNSAIGTLNLGSKKAFAYSENDFLFVQQLADQLSVCLQNMRLYAEVYDAKMEIEETFNAVQDQIFLLKEDCIILKTNNGMKPDELIGRKCTNLLPFCEGYCSICPVADAFKTGTSISKDVTLPNISKSYSIYVAPIFNNKKVIDKMVVYVKDITAKIKIETQLFQSAKLVAIGEMAAGVAHELNSPLTAIIGNAKLILRRIDESDKIYKLLWDINNCGQRCQKIIQNLLIFARKDRFSFEPVQINRIVENSLLLVGYQIEQDNIFIHKELTSNIPTIMGNAVQLEQVIINFLINARDAMENVVERQIVVSTRLIDYHERLSVEVAVSDTGTGISSEKIGDIFNPFFTTKEISRGTGLGLSVSLGIAESHGGTIAVDSTLDIGSRFSLILPI